MDEFSSALEGSGWLAGFRQLDRGSRPMDLRVAATESMALLRVDVRNHVHQEGLPDSNNFTFGLPTRPQAPGRFGRRVLESESLTCFDASNGMDVVSPAGFSAYTLSFNRQRLSELAPLLELPDPADSMEMPGSQRLPPPARLAQLRALLDELFAVLDREQPQQSETALRSIEYELPALLLSTWYQSEAPTYTPSSNRIRALRSALEYVRANPQKPVTVEELCLVSASSISTLERAFGEHFQTSPKQFLIAYRLKGVRDALKNPEDERSISDIATTWGFWHLSKFAADYRKTFSELPSETRKSVML